MKCYRKTRSHKKTLITFRNNQKFFFHSNEIESTWFRINNHSINLIDVYLSYMFDGWEANALEKKLCTILKI